MRNRRVLIVDDLPEVLDTLSLILEDHHFEVHRASNAEQALAICEEKGPVACVLSDQEMPGQTGIELLASVHDAWPDTSRVLMTGFAELELAVKALHQGRIFRLLRKPFAADAVLETMDAALEQFDHVQRQRIMTEELLFSRETLLGMTGELERRLGDEMRNLEGLQKLAAQLSSSRSLDEVARIAARAISQALDGRSVRVELENPYRLEERAAAVAQGEPVTDPYTEHVETDAGSVGRIVVENAGSLGGRDKRVLGSLACSAALATHSQISRFERDEAQHATVFAMARLAERRDNETGQHLDRVSEYCSLIARGLREDGHYVEDITDRFIDDLVRSAPLHDIGKVGIPDRILLKPGKLNEDEWEMMKQHAVIGGDTMRSIIESTAQPGFLLLGHDIALFHHEKWNGSGYPQGLRGADIPLCARIVALADVYDALTTRRPYKQPWPHSKALDLIKSESGEHFDPAIVKAFLLRADEADRIRRRLPDIDDSDALAA